MSQKLLPLYKSPEVQELQQSLDAFFNELVDAMSKASGIPKRYLTGAAPTKVDNDTDMAK
jgi:hypothetical protein